MNQGGKVAKNIIIYLSAIGIQKVLVTIYFWYYSTRISVEDLGTYIFVLGFASFFGVLVDIGFLPILTRTSAQNVEKGAIYLRNILGLKCFLTVFALAVVFLVHFISPKSPLLFVVIAAVIMVLDSFKQTLYGFIRGRGNFNFESASVFLYQTVTMVFGVLALQFTKNIAYLLGSLCIASILDVLYAGSMLAFKFKISFFPSLNLAVIKEILRSVPSFAAAGLFNKGYVAADVIILRYLGSPAMLGVFAVPAKIISSLQSLIPTAFGSVLFPAMSGYNLDNPQKLRKLLSMSLIYLFFISAPLGTALFVFSSAFISALWSKTFAESIDVLTVLAFALPFIFWTFPLGAYLNASGHERYATMHRGIILLFTIVWDIVFIPLSGIMGIAIGWVASSALLFIMDLLRVRKLIALDFGYIIGRSMRILNNAVLMGVVGFALKRLAPLWLSVPLLIGFYLGTSLLFKAVSINEIRSLKEL